jgi:hypothetical protein
LTNGRSDGNGRSGRISSVLSSWFESLDRVELIATTVLAIAAIATAWSGFQSAKWSGEQAIAFSEASAARTESTRASTEAGQLTQIDVGLFLEWLSAIESERQAGVEVIVPGEPYVPDPGTLHGFLFDRFREEFRPAMDAWLASNPLIDPSAPGSPFEMDEYRLDASDRADELLATAEQRAGDARQANLTSDQYVLTGVLFALVLFFAGVSSKLNRSRNRSIMMMLALIGLVYGISSVLLLPIQSPF